MHAEKCKRGQVGGNDLELIRNCSEIQFSVQFARALDQGAPTIILSRIGRGRKSEKLHFPCHRKAL